MHSLSLYKKYSQGQHWKKHPTVYAGTFAEFLKSKNFKGSILDIGCGSGRDVDFLHRQGFDVIGIDTNKEEIEKACIQFPKLKLQEGNAEKLDFPDTSIDACFMINVIHYLNMEKAIEEVYRVLTPGGYFFIHFNLDIIDDEGNNDYHHDQNDILKLLSQFEILNKRTLTRIDREPIKHTHFILELVLQKPIGN